MLKTIARLEHVIGDRVYHLLCDSDSPLHEVQEAAVSFLKYLGRVEDAAKQQEELQQKEKEPQDEARKAGEESSQAS